MGDILAGVPPEVVTGGGFAGLVFLFVWLMFTGRVVSRAVHEETRADRDSWRRAAEVQSQRLDVISAQVDRLLIGQQVSDQFQKSLQDYIRQQRQEGGST